MAMLNAHAIDESLSEMRRSSGLTLEEVGRQLGEILGRPPYTHPRIIQIEQEGTRDTDQLEALARIYSRPFEAVYIAAKKLRK